MQEFVLSISKIMVTPDPSNTNDLVTDPQMLASLKAMPYQHKIFMRKLQ